jgi:hypothetical protein
VLPFVFELVFVPAPLFPEVEPPFTTAPVLPFDALPPSLPPPPQAARIRLMVSAEASVILRI